MSAAWQPLATHGDTPDQVRAALEEAAAAALQKARRELREMGLSAVQREAVMQLLSKLQADAIDAAVPRMMEDMEATAGRH